MSRDLVGIDLGELGCLSIAQSQGFRCQVSMSRIQVSMSRIQVSGVIEIPGVRCQVSG